MNTEQFDRPPTLSVVVPVYNEGPNIAAALRDIRAHAPSSREIIVVYDFEADDTVPVVRSLRDEMLDVELLLNTRGRGVLQAMRTGIDASRGDFVLITMGDRSDDLSGLGRMLELARGGAAIVAASRYASGGREQGGPLLKRTLSRLAGTLLHVIGGLPIHDPTSAFKLYSGTFIRSLEIESTAGFALALELCVKAHRRGLRLAEIPTVWSDRVAGTSRFQLWRWMPHYLRWFFYGIVGRFR